MFFSNADAKVATFLELANISAIFFAENPIFSLFCFLYLFIIYKIPKKPARDTAALNNNRIFALQKPLTRSQSPETRLEL